jgi:Ca-activated chloride channel family protein
MGSRVPAVLVGFFALALFAAAPMVARNADVTIVGSVVDASLNPLAGVAVTLERNGRAEARTTTDTRGEFRFASVAPGSLRIRAERAGYPVLLRDVTVPAGASTVRLPIVLVRPADKTAARAAEAGPPPAATPIPPAGATIVGAGSGRGGGGGGGGRSSTVFGLPQRSAGVDWNQPAYGRDTGETYDRFEPNRFHSTLDRPLSTFGADVDTASYSNIRRFLSSGQLPPSEAVRIEELVNYFRFGYAQPRDGRPIALTTEIGDCPWAPSHRLVLIGARAAAPAARETTDRNIVLLVDVSGSMSPAERLPLIKTALGLFADTLRPDDSLAIVTYAGSSGIALPPTRARHRETIQRAIANLNAGGSTNGGQGLILAYRTAREAYMPGGVNRVILATDGDFNVGITSQQDLLRLIERERDSGVFLSVFGVGSGNLKDATMEMLADRGNGHYAYLDSLQEARRVLIREGEATLEAVAKDVKFQVEFNPAVVSSWKLLGYENRALAARDFNNDRKDAGEMGAGHTVTVLYEVVPVGVDRTRDERDDDRPSVDPLKYQSQPAVVRPSPRPAPGVVAANGEWLTVKARYKEPEGDTSALITHAVRAGGRVQHLPLATAVAEFGQILRDAPRNIERWDALERRAARLTAPASLAADLDGFRELVATARGLARLR